MELIQALSQLDVDDDDHWTADGMPRMDVLQRLTETPDLKRGDVTNAAPELTRDALREAIAKKNEEAEKAREAEEAGSSDLSEEDQAEQKSEEEAATSEQPPAEKPPEPQYNEFGHLVQEEGLGIVVEAQKKPTVTMEQLEEARDRVAEELLKLNRELEEVKGRVDVKNAEADAINRNIEHLMTWDPDRGQKPIQDYLARQNEVRTEKAERLEALKEVTGLTPKEIQEQLGGASKLDDAMKGRKPARGSQRPAVRQPQNAAS